MGSALKTFLDNLYLEPNNGYAERVMYPITIGRDNGMSLDNKREGATMGVLMSLVQTCHAMDINALTYLEDVLRRINGHSASRLAKLLPGNWKKGRILLLSLNLRGLCQLCTSNDAYK